MGYELMAEGDLQYLTCVPAHAVPASLFKIEEDDDSDDDGAGFGCGGKRSVFACAALTPACWTIYHDPVTGKLCDSGCATNGSTVAALRRGHCGNPLGRVVAWLCSGIWARKDNDSQSKTA